jgi:hypothetical protein
LARTPQTNEAFLREVDEELRRDELTRFWRRWGRVLVAAIGIGLVTFAAYLWWQGRQSAQAGVEGEKLNTAVEQLSANQIDRAMPALKELAGSERAGYRAASRLASGAIAGQKGELKAAAEAYGAVVKDEEVG